MKKLKHDGKMKVRCKFMYTTKEDFEKLCYLYLNDENSVTIHLAKSPLL